MHLQAQAATGTGAEAGEHTSNFVVFHTSWFEIPTGGPATDLSKEARLEGRLHAVGKEITAVEAGLQGLDDAEAAAAEAAEAAELEPAEGASPREGASGTAARTADWDLQRAGLRQRLSDLQATQRHAQAALQAERASPEAREGSHDARAQQAAPGAALLAEDTGLDEELDAAQNSSLVETERDRLIRLVRSRCALCAEPSSACTACCRVACLHVRSVGSLPECACMGACSIQHAQIPLSAPCAGRADAL